MINSEKDVENSKKDKILDDKDSSAVETGRQLVYFAAERTLMAWIRASLSLMTLGFVLDRFGLILHQFLSPDNVHLFPRIFSQWAGVGMVVLGSVLALLATIRYLKFHLSYYQEGATRPGQGILVGVIFACILAVLGVVLAVFMFLAAGA